jgi:hypothetical protein
MPLWLARRAVEDGVAPLPEGDLESILFGQSCLFYAIRLQDDILDGALTRSPLALAPILFMSESARAFTPFMGAKTAFRQHYHEAIESTARGIALVAEMQREPVADPDRLLELYGLVDAALAVGSLAVCHLVGRGEWVLRVRTFVSELGKVLLVLDDLDDVEEDLKDGRITYPVRALLTAAAAANPDPRALSESWKNRAHPAGFSPLSDVLGEALRRAASAIESLGLREAMNLIGRVDHAVRRIVDST